MLVRLGGDDAEFLSLVWVRFDMEASIRSKNILMEAIESVTSYVDESFRHKPFQASKKVLVYPDFVKTSLLYGFSLKFCSS